MNRVLLGKIWRHLVSEWQPELGSTLSDYALMQGLQPGIYTLA